jgi:hypothetical protein
MERGYYLKPTIEPSCRITALSLIFAEVAPLSERPFTDIPFTDIPACAAEANAPAKTPRNTAQ